MTEQGLGSLPIDRLLSSCNIFLAPPGSAARPRAALTLSGRKVALTVVGLWAFERWSCGHRRECRSLCGCWLAGHRISS